MSVKLRCGGESNCVQKGYSLVEVSGRVPLFQPSVGCGCPPTHVPSNPNACTLVSVANPTSELLIPELLAPGAFGIQHVIGQAVDLTGWTKDLVIDALDAFDNATGTFTAPVSGDYLIAAVISYETSVPLTPDAELTNVPYIEIYDIANPTGHLLTGQLPSNSQIITIPPISSGEFPIEVIATSVTSRAQVILTAALPLIEGQQIRLRAVTNGLTYTAPIAISQVLPPLPPRIVFFTNTSDTTLTIYRIRNSPIVTIDCNN